MKIFQNLFSPKWKSKNSETRKNALIALAIEENQTIFETIVSSDDVSDIRLLALKRISRVEQIEHIAENNSDQKTRELANKLLHEFLAGTSHSSVIKAITEQERIDKISLCNEQICIEFVAQNGASSEIRAIAIAKVSREALLGDLVIKEANRNIRLTIAEKITQKSTLERVLKAIKNKDKQISKVIKTKLDDIIAAELRPKQLLDKQKSLCLSMEQIGKKGLWERDKIQFDQLTTQWAKLANSDVLDLQNRFTNASQIFSKNYKDYLARNAERLQQEAALQPLREEKESLLKQLTQLLSLVSEQSVSSVDELKNSVQSLNKQWKVLESLPSDLETEYESQYRDISRNIKNHLSGIQNANRTQSTLSSVQTDVEFILKKPSRLSEEKINQLNSKLASIDSNDENISEKLDTVKNLLVKASTVLAQSVKKSNELYKKTKTLIDDLYEKIENGQISEANSNQKTIISNIKQLERFGHKQLTAIKSQSTETSNKLFELNKWRSWANTPQKQRLVEEMEALVDADIDPKEIAFMVSNARKQWQKLGPSERETSKTLWERFNKACDSAYKPCKTVFANEAKIRNENFSKRIDFLNDLETFVSQENWQPVNWGKVENLFQQSRNEWNNLGTIDKSKRKALNTRFNNAHNNLKAHLIKEWDRNLVIKQEIVKNALLAVTEENLDDAINTAKKLQQQWKSTGRIQRHQETELWTKFRGSCDEIFARRDALKQQQKSDELDNENSKLSLCENLEQLCSAPITQISKNVEKVFALKKQISALPASNNKLDNDIKSRIDSALKTLDFRRESATRIDQIHLLQKLKQKIELVQQLEQLLEKEESINWETTTEKFGSLDPIVDDNLSSAINQRYDALKDTSNWSQFAESVSSNLKTIQNSTIQLEIIAEVDTPAASAPDRLKIQTERLANKLNHRQDENQWEAFIQAETNWLLTGPLPSTELADFRSRHSIVIDAMKEQYTEELENY